MFTMPAITLVVFILGYIDIACRFISQVSGGGSLALKIVYLGIVISASNRKKWARAVWSMYIIVGIIVAAIGLIGVMRQTKVDGNILFFLSDLPCSIVLSIVFSIVMLVLLWHPSTTDWFERE